MNTITPLTGIPSTGSSTSQPGGQGKHPAPKQGQVFKALVVEAKGLNTYVLDIGGNRLSANATMPLSIGQSLQLQVVTTTPQVELQVVSDSANLFLGKSITLIGKNIDITALFQSFQKSGAATSDKLTSVSRQTLESFFNFSQSGLGGKDGGQMLKQFIDRLGISFEALLARGQQDSAKATLKSALLEISQLFKGAEELAENTNKLLNTIELYQHAQLQLDKENLLIFPLPIPFLEKGYLIIERSADDENDENDGERDGKNFSLHLSLAELGNLRVDFHQNESGIFIKFISDSQEKIDFIEQFKDNLLQKFAEPEILGISFAIENIDPATDLLKRLIPDGKSIVNTKV